MKKVFIPVHTANKIVSNKQVEQFYQRIDESYGVTLGLSRLIRYIIFMTEKCLMLSSKKSLQNLSGLPDVILDYKRAVTENFIEDCFWVSLRKADARVINLDLEDSVLCVKCRTFETEDDFNKSACFDNFGKIYSTTDESNSGDIIGKIFIEIIQYPIYQNGYFMFYQKFAGGTEFVQVTELIPQIQHKLSYMYNEHATKYNKDYETVYTDTELINVPVAESMTYIGRLNEGCCKIRQRINIGRRAQK